MPDVHWLFLLNYSDKGLWHTSGLGTYSKYSCVRTDFVGSRKMKKNDRDCAAMAGTCVNVKVSAIRAKFAVIHIRQDRIEYMSNVPSHIVRIFAVDSWAINCAGRDDSARALGINPYRPT